MPPYEISLHEAIAEFEPYVDSYWRDFGGDLVYCACVDAVFVRQDGTIVGHSFHVNAPTRDSFDFFERAVLDAAEMCESEAA